MLRRGSRCASTSSLESCRLVARIAGGLPGRVVPRGSRGTRGARVWRRGRRRLARPGAGRARCGARRSGAALSSARPIVAELACARTRGHRQHRSGLPADQQVVQPVIQRTRPLAMLRTLRQICSVGIVTEPMPARRRIPQGPRRAASAGPRRARPRALHTSRRRRLLQWLRARDPRHRESRLQHRRCRNPVRREPAPCGSAAGDRAGIDAHGDRAATHLRGDARPEARRRDRRLRLHRWHLRRKPRIVAVASRMCCRSMLRCRGVRRARRGSCRVF